MGTTTATNGKNDEEADEKTGARLGEEPVAKADIWRVTRTRVNAEVCGNEPRGTSARTIAYSAKNAPAREYERRHAPVCGTHYRKTGLDCAQDRMRQMLLRFACPVEPGIVYN